MNRFPYPFFSILFLLPGFLYGQNEKVTIQGEAPAFKGKKVELITVKDHLTKMDSVLDSSRVDPESGDFELKAHCAKVLPARVRIASTRSKIYLDPGSDYKVEFPEPRKGTLRNPYGRTQVEMTFYGLDKFDANNLVIDLNRIYDDFFARNYRHIAAQQQGSSDYVKHRMDEELRPDSIPERNGPEGPSLSVLVDSLDRSLAERYEEVDREWFRLHMEHALSSLRDLVPQSRTDRYERYFADEKVHYDHEEYMDHFLEFYDGSFIKAMRRNDSIRLDRVLREKEGKAPLMEALKGRDHMEREEIRELVLIDGMFDAFHHRENFNKEGVQHTLKEIAAESPRPGARKMAKNLSEFLSRRQKGRRAPDFALTSRDTQTVSLKELEGKPVYMNFWATWSETSIKDMEQIRKLHEDHGHNFHFVSICTDETLLDMQEFLEEHPEHDWTFLHLGSHDEVEKAYEVATIPSYYMLDEQGRFLKVPAPEPGRELRSIIHKISSRIDRRKKKRQQGRGVWDH